ncbi:putative membrane protein [Wickerhamomyces ciferrii]|uniref:Membrane protein n=1 Tax=Wickerhamomyces ciferrii (strain ATCC 14091 / BCRC 22168 / CBS 111 / JCM 3599 / NBRC 0793 / NRRL Y-1031 F-60-10) TaxID=1206466 RepID=K0KVE8_WICCF|nr:uncharacterized protein BN7_5474 [Wickerhamomyces ciferrii]CCH45887.1 putative membrane protein [Wickerhamomyces ciferrii]
MMIFLVLMVSGTLAAQVSHVNDTIYATDLVHVNGSLSLRGGNVKRDISSDTDLDVAFKNVASSVVLNEEAALNYENSLSNIVNNSTSIDKRDVVNWIAGTLTTWAVASGTVAYMAQYCMNQRSGDNFFKKNWACVMLAQAITIGATTSYAYLAYQGTISAGFQYISGLANSNGSKINKREAEFDIPNYGWYNHSSLAHQIGAQGLSIDNIEYEYAFVGDDGTPFIHRPKYRLSLNSKPLVEISMHNGTLFSHIGDLGYNDDTTDPEKPDKRDYVGEDEWNRVYFTQGGLLEEGCKYDGSSETLTMPKDLNMVYNLLNDFTGFWYYNSDKVTHWYIKDNNHNKDIAEGLLQRNTENFGYWQFTQPYNLCYGDGDWA